MHQASVRPGILAGCAALLAGWLAAAPPAGAAGTGPPVITSLPFHVYRVPFATSPHAHADLEFLWSDHYAAPLGTVLASPDSGSKLLDQLGRQLCDVQSNPFGYPVGDMELVYDYLKMPDPDHPAAPYATSGLFVSGIPGAVDANHFDIYLYVPRTASYWGDAILADGMSTTSNARYNYGQAYSDFWSPLEDTSSGRPANIASVEHHNSLMWPGPALESGTSLSWITPGNCVGLLHEFQHVFNRESPRRYTEIFSRAAEVLSAPPDSSVYDITYTKPLLPSNTLDTYNYEGWESFDAYLAYGFQGVIPGFAGRADDVLWRWAHAPERTFIGLAESLDSLSCPTCDYFDGLSLPERVGTFIHNWRIASFVDNYALANHQYGFDPAFGFHPRRQMGAFQDRDGVASDNAGVLPVEMSAIPAWRIQPVSLAEQPAVPGQYAARPLRLGLWGSECCVVHSSSLGGAGDDTLALSIVPEGLASCIPDDSTTAACDTAATHPDYVRGRLRVSIVRYAQDAADLYAHPEWALGVETRSTDVSIPSPGLVFQVPQFGGATKAAVIIATLEGLDENSIRVDAPVRPDAGNSVPIRIVAGLGGGDASPQIPAVGPRAQDYGTWAADGQHVLFQASVAPDTALSQVYQVSASGGTPVRLWPQPLDQRRPDCSPLGQLVAFEQDSVAGVSKIWLIGADATNPHRLTTAPGLETAPAFSPNGQRVAYAWRPLAAMVGRVAALHVVDLDGTHDVEVAAGQPTTIRWSEDGTRLYYCESTSTPQPVQWVTVAADSLGGRAAGIDAASGSVFDFDLRPFGGGELAGVENFRYVYECASTAACAECGASPVAITMPVAGRRVVSRLGTPAAAAPDTATLFTWAGASATHARWSPDGTRLLFSADRARPGDPDLYVTPVSRNHPPVFTPASIADVSGPALSRDLAAADPEGQPVSYAAAPLPPGATLVGNQLRWTPTPGQAGTYYIRLRAADASGGVASAVIKAVMLSESTGSSLPGSPTRFALMPPQPNPARGLSRLALALPRAADVKVEVLDTQGRLVKTLLDGHLEAGYRQVIWDGRTASGAAARSGVYFVSMRAGDFVGRRRLVLLH